MPNVYYAHPVTRYWAFRLVFALQVEVYVIYRAILSALKTALMSEAVQLRLIRLVETAVARQNDDQLARIRADLSHMEARLSARMDTIEARVSALESQRAGELPGPPPFRPEEQK